jgi:hypothetical protein
VIHRFISFLQRWRILRAGDDQRKLEDIIMKFKNADEAGVRERVGVGWCLTFGFLLSFICPSSGPRSL